jgi:subtilase family serine protease
MQDNKAAFYCSAHFNSTRKMWLSFVVSTLIGCAALTASAADGQFVAHSTPSYVATAKNLGTEDPTKTIEVSIWLNPHNRGEMDALARQLYDRTSANYRHFLSRSQIAQRFAPTAEEAKTVQVFFEAHNLKVVKVGPDNFFVRARGTVGDVETAFHVLLNNYQVRDKIIRANSSDPYVEGAAAPLVRSVSGLDTGKYEHPMMARPTSLGKNGPAGVSAAEAGMKTALAPPSSFYTPNCFDGVVTDVLSTDNNGSLPIGTYKGNHLNLQSLTSAGCAYTPPPIQTAYNLTGLYAEGYQGQGQTIVILDWCGSPTIQSDANAFSAMFGLPLLGSSNFNIIYTPTPSLCEAPDSVEINIDVEWAHAIAPMANIDLVVPPSASFQDVNEAEYFAVNYGLGNVISGSYGSVEPFTSTAELENENLISEIAAISGISTNFSSGDDGDYTAFGLPASVNAPADSPWATAVGGVSLALNADNSIAWQAGWGNNEVELTDSGFIADPPIDFGFYAGAGGGPSNCVLQKFVGTPPTTEVCLAGYPKPAFQESLPGKYRQLPDVAWLADPFTGVAILISVPGQVPEQVWQVYGGTSVACPMFSALWAIANQEAQGPKKVNPPLGQAAQYLYSMPAGAITDIVPVGSPTNVRASIQEPTMTNNYTPSEVLGAGGLPPGPSAAPGKFVSAIWDYPYLESTELVISFGTDCSALPSTDKDGTPCNTSSALHTKVGWDNVTGMGVPNAKAFADAFKPAAAAAK